ncbi:hypothetical protein K2173_026757 [Erythroxylum novogranatense]|uniref:Uncharacterized protein n=1 Tax=Erythroxylum novogranatense TaxID=1862640 RepID=A0AAV8TX75_9ROSI|nr:hypothetical protein K2173_026757 [Erythroxylum novogranatense]
MKSVKWQGDHYVVVSDEATKPSTSERSQGIRGEGTQREGPSLHEEADAKKKKISREMDSHGCDSSNHTRE